jgi:hypothetical protein
VVSSPSSCKEKSENCAKTGGNGKSSGFCSDQYSHHVVKRRGTVISNMSKTNNGKTYCIQLNIRAEFSSVFTRRGSLGNHSLWRAVNNYWPELSLRSEESYLCPSACNTDYASQQR